MIPSVPQELRGRRQWVLWKSETRGGKPTKVPYQRGGGKAAVDDPQTWTDYASVVRDAHNFDGIGFVFTADDGITGIDLDKCRDAETGAIEPWAQAVVDLLASYTEITPSKTGLHVLTLAELPGGDGKRKDVTEGRIEMYDRGRYFTVTGNHLEGTPETIEPRQDETIAVYRQYFPEQPKPLPMQSNGVSASDREVLALALGAKNGGKFAQLWEGNWAGAGYGSQSEADSALCFMLRFYTQDAAQLDRLFRSSSLMREKWDEKRKEGTYGTQTIERALSSPGETYRPPAPRVATPVPPREEPLARHDDRDAIDVNAYPLTDAGNAEVLVALYGDRLRYRHDLGRWLVWRDHAWRQDDDGEIHRLVLDVARNRHYAAVRIEDKDKRVQATRHALRSEDRPKLEAAVWAARSLHPVTQSGEGWDADPWVLGVKNGVLDLKAGELRAGKPSDRISRQAACAFDPDARCPRFDAFLERVQPDPEMRAYLQRRAGYQMTGKVNEQDLAFDYGVGANGKTTFNTALMDVLGDYADEGAPGLLLRTKHEQHPTAMADLRGMRLVVSAEAGRGRSLDEERVKQLTGGDPIKARHMRQDFFRFEPTHKHVLLANNKPRIRGTDYAIWRRMKLTPWRVVIPKEEKRDLREPLKAEAAGILNWMLAGCLAWQRDGLAEPDAVIEATEAYREESNVLADFLNDCTERHEFARVGATQAFQAYQHHAQRTGVPEKERLTQTAFGSVMRDQFEHGRDGRTGVFYIGFRLAGEGCEGL